MEINSRTLVALGSTETSSSGAQCGPPPPAGPKIPDIDYALLDWPPEEGNPEAELWRIGELPAPVRDEVYTSGQRTTVIDPTDKETDALPNNEQGNP